MNKVFDQLYKFSIFCAIIIVEGETYMQKKVVLNIIKEIIDTLNIPNEELNENLELETFKYTGNIKSENDSYKLHTNPEIQLIGRKKIEKYHMLYRKLYDEMEASKKYISFKYFKENTQQLFFTNKFTFDDLCEFLNKLKTQTYYCASPVWGLSLATPEYSLGKFVFIRKDNIIDYVKTKVNSKDDFLFNHSISFIDKHSKNPANFVYVVLKYDTYDSVYAYELFQKELDVIVKVIRYMVGFSRDRIYVDKKQYIENQESQIQFTKENILTGTKVNRKDVEINLDDEHFSLIKNGNNKIWQILSKETPSELETRIINAIQWAGRSLNEEIGDNISITQIAFAFETLLKRNKEVTPITSSIQGSISEMVSFIVESDVEKRLEKVKRFKDFYSKRSAIVHGAISQKDVYMYYEFLYTLKEFITQILTNEKYQKCNSTEDLYKLIEKYKYRSDNDRKDD